LDGIFQYFSLGNLGQTNSECDWSSMDLV